ncbi:MAG: extracellular solute-binding protein [Chloroflexi bacterium]|nr:extracellular solute-binding protein [Chloroflexota bacterium]
MRLGNVLKVRAALVVLAILVAVVIAACAPAESKPPAAPAAKSDAKAVESGEWDKIAKAGKDKGKVTWYGFGPLERVAARAAEVLGMQIDFANMRATESRERVITEVSTGRPVADAVQIGPSFAMEGTKLGVFQELGPLPNLRFVPEKYRDPGGLNVPVAINTYGILVNTDLVKAGEEPKSWQDLLDPKWKGKLLADDPRAPGNGNTLFGSLLSRFGRKYHEQLAQQQVHFTRNYAENLRALARGEFAVFFPVKFMDLFAVLKGTPTKGIVPREGVSGVTVTNAVVKGARNADGGRLLINWLLTEEGQKLLLEAGSTPVRGDVNYGGEVAQFLPATVGVDVWLWTMEELDGIGKIVAEMEAIYGK